MTIDSPLVLTRTLTELAAPPVAPSFTPTPTAQPPTAPPPSPPSPVIYQQAPAAAQTTRAVDTVREYYRLWNLGDFRTMYGMLSSNFEAKHPYDLYVKYHSLVTQIIVDAEQDSMPYVVHVHIDSHNREKDGSLTHAVNEGRWNLVWEDGTWKLDSQDVHETQ